MTWLSRSAKGTRLGCGDEHSNINFHSLSGPYINSCGEGHEAGLRRAAARKARRDEDPGADLIRRNAHGRRAGSGPIAHASLHHPGPRRARAIGRRRRTRAPARWLRRPLTAPLTTAPATLARRARSPPPHPPPSSAQKMDTEKKCRQPAAFPIRPRASQAGLRKTPKAVENEAENGRK